MNSEYLVHFWAPVAIGSQQLFKMLKMKITFLEFLRIVFSFLVAGDGYYLLVIFHSRVTINTFK